MSDKKLIHISCNYCGKPSTTMLTLDDTVPVSELREWIIKNTHQVYSDQFGGEIDYISPYGLLTKFCEVKE